jgi:hypothetical protein
MAIFGASVTLPQDAFATSDAYPKDLGSFREATEVQPVEMSPFRRVSLTSDASFTDSLLQNRTETASNTSVQDNSLTPRDNGPGARVPEPGTFFLAVAGLVGLTRFSSKGRPRSI